MRFGKTYLGQKASQQDTPQKILEKAMEGEFGPVRLTTRNKGDHMRILFKTPHQVFFRRCFFVKSERVIDGNRLKVVHGMFGRKETEIPLDGTVIRRFGIRK